MYNTLFNNLMDLSWILTNFSENKNEKPIFIKDYDNYSKSSKKCF